MALRDFNGKRQSSVGTAGPQRRAPELSGHCRTSTARARSQWALRDLNGERQISVGTAGPQLREPDLSGHCGASTASARAQLALPDLNCESQISVGTACETSIASARCHIQCQKRFQIECQNTCILCQTECQNICPIECQNRYVKVGGDHSMKVTFIFSCFPIIHGNMMVFFSKLVH